jgi:stringent starvation protein A
MSVVKRSVMTLYSNSLDIYSHRVRIVLAEKAMSVDVINVNPAAPPESLVRINPYASVPTLVDRDLVLYHHHVIAEYLDERFPHPPLMLVYPVARAKSRLMVYRIERDWYSLYQQLCGQHPDQAQARAMLADSLLGLEPVFADSPYFLSEEFTLVDCSIAPLLWRLPQLGIVVPKKYKAIHAYMQRVFERPSFQTSLSEAERVMHE